uniref:Uncharacterized protein n=1 Tax=Oryza glumipatula TaxID=40148 RepID=A0A0D9ZIE2_9ORYZ
MPAVGRSPSLEHCRPSPRANTFASTRQTHSLTFPFFSPSEISHHRYLPYRPELSPCHRRSGHISHFHCRPLPSRDARRRGTRYVAGAAAFRPPEDRRPARLLFSLPATNRRGEERRREEEGEEKEKERLTATKKPPVKTSHLLWGRSRFTIPDVEPLVVKSGKTQTKGRSATPGTPRLNAYNGRSFTILSTSNTRHIVRSRAMCDPNRSATTHGCRSNTSTKPTQTSHPSIRYISLLYLDGNLWYFEHRIIRLPISDLFALEQGKLLFLPFEHNYPIFYILFYALAIHDFEYII